MDFTKKFGSRNPEHSAEWCQFDDAEFLIAPLDNMAYMEWAQKKFSIAQLEAIQRGEYSALGDNAAAVFDLMAEGFASSILLNWNNLTEGDTPLAYTVEKAQEFLRYPQFFDWVRTQSENVAAKQKETKEAKEKKIK